MYNELQNEIIHIITTKIPKIIYKSIYLEVQKIQNIQWLDMMTHFEINIQKLLQKDVKLN